MVAVPLLVTSAMLLSQPASSHGYRSQHITNDILTFAKTRNIGSIVILTCWPLGAKSEAALLMSQHGIMVSFSIKTILNSKRKPDQRSGAVIDFSCPKAAFLVRNVFVWDLFDAGTDWLVVAEEWPSEKPATERLLEAFQNVFPSSDSNVFLSVENKMENCTDACRKKLFEVYGGATVPVEGYSFQVDWNRRSDLRSALLRTCTVVRTSGKELATKTPDSLMEMDVWALMHASVIEILSHQLNFRYEMYFVNDYGWSFNGNYSGLMGLFQRGKIDLTATGIFTRPDRLPLVDYTVETFQIRSTILFRQPPLSRSTNIFVLPFSSGVWLWCCVLVAGALVVLVAATRGRYVVKRSHYAPPPVADIFSLLVAIVCQQSFDIKLVSLSARICLLMVSLGCQFLYTCYSASVVVLLQTPSPVIQNINDLVHSPLSFKMQNVSYNNIYLQEAKDVTTSALYSRKVEPQGHNVYVSIQDGVQLVKDAKAAFLVEANNAYENIRRTFSEDEKCGLGELQLFVIPSLTMAVAKNSGLREITAQRLIRQREVGLMDRIKKRHIFDKPDCNSMRMSYANVGIQDFSPAIISTLGYGIPACLVVLILECIFFVVVRQKKKAIVLK